MPVHPQIAKALEALAKANLPAIEDLEPQAARIQMDQMSKARGGEPTPLPKIEDRKIPGPAGDIPVRIYWPEGEKPHPIVVYFHGGGHVIGNLDTHDKVARNLAAGSGAIFISVDYRMGPEHRFPAAVEDSWAALLWAYTHAAEIGGDPTKLAVSGDSAGGNLAGVMALMARDAGAPKLALQSLVYPVGDYSLSAESYRKYGKGFGILTANAMKWFQEHYLNDASDVDDWRASPLKAKSFAGTAPAIIVAAECDVLVDDGKAYADRLQADGVHVDYRVYEGMIHAFFGMAPDIDGAVQAQKDVSLALRAAFEGK
jgi:acetyl esterase